jgi:hypothetical protein
VTTPVAPNDFATHAPNGVPTQNPTTCTIARSAAGAHAEVPIGARWRAAASVVWARTFCAAGLNTDRQLWIGPAVVNVRSVLFVLAVGRVDRDETVALIETSSGGVALERP